MHRESYFGAACVGFSATPHSGHGASTGNPLRSYPHDWHCPGLGSRDSIHHSAAPVSASPKMNPGSSMLEVEALRKVPGVMGGSGVARLKSAKFGSLRCTNQRAAGAPAGTWKSPSNRPKCRPPLVTQKADTRVGDTTRTRPNIHR